MLMAREDLRNITHAVEIRLILAPENYF